MKIIKTQQAVCSTCGGSVRDVLPMPKLPVTGVYVRQGETARLSEADQVLQHCGACGHAQLQNVIDPALVYDQTYFHRSSLSPISAAGNDFLIGFLRDVVGDRRFERVLEIGCNDLYLLSKIKDLGKEFHGLDPIWIDQPVEHQDGVHVIGKFVEQLDVKQDCGGAPDLIVSAHTFEHLETPRESLNHLMRGADPEALLLIEVPGFESSLKNTRFDHVFHQHLQYYSLHSLLSMVESLGGKYVKHAYNYGYWGGTLLLAFALEGSKTWVANRPKTAPISEEYLRGQWDLYRAQMAATAQLLTQVKREEGSPIVGYGGAQMLPSLFYHLPLDANLVEVIWDDNAERDGLFYPTYPFAIRKPPEAFSLAGSNVLITALDSARGIAKRCLALGACRIVFPVHAI